MVIILPPFEDGSLSETVARMTPEKVQGVMAEIKSGFYKADDLTIQIPKFAIEQVWKNIMGKKIGTSKRNYLRQISEFYDAVIISYIY